MSTWASDTWQRGPKRARTRLSGGCAGFRRAAPTHMLTDTLLVPRRCLPRLPYPLPPGAIRSCCRAPPAPARPAWWRTWPRRRGTPSCASTTTSTRTCRWGLAVAYRDRSRGLTGGSHYTCSGSPLLSAPSAAAVRMSLSLPPCCFAAHSLHFHHILLHSLRFVRPSPPQEYLGNYVSVVRMSIP